MIRVLNLSTMDEELRSCSILRLATEVVLQVKSYVFESAAVS
jgi:hypothetical protein